MEWAATWMGCALAVAFAVVKPSVSVMNHIWILELTFFSLNVAHGLGLFLAATLQLWVTGLFTECSFDVTLLEDMDVWGILVLRSAMPLAVVSYVPTSFSWKSVVRLKAYHLEQLPHC